MNTKKTFFKPAGNHIIFEQFDTETVMINLKSGHYFSMNPSGQRIWDLLRHWPTLEEILLALGPEERAGKSGIQNEVAAFLDTLVEQGLTERVPQRPDGLPPLTRDAAADYAPPQIQVFTDQKELLLLDPIHEVDEPGWPTPKED